MKQVATGSIIMMLGALSAGCVTPVAGADEVTITINPADVSACSAVGRIDDTAMINPDRNIAKNQAAGLSANVILNTGRGGIAYRCGKAAVPSQ
jgi:hypothetical protein